ncbi:hypothetical protein PhCBS80983_g01091 [Powellomyces hirtus]|uniref:ABM domain-containing protein n=1 Tax=Powellomyces hirtus TaxID=109895 RepID=A0A507EE95_9FUNG|nr:hypothetical protein PhCBS80983_g01091 [Powellomyces hirtus]
MNASSASLTTPSPLSRSNSAATAPIIYEINLSVPADKYAGYLEYLTNFVKQTCGEIDGFTGAQVFTQPKPVGLHWLSEEGSAKAYLTVHYHVASQIHLDLYLKDHQHRVAEADQAKWEHLVTSRRILRLNFSTIEG